MKRVTVHAVLALAVIGALLAGCSYGTPGQAESTSTSDPASSAPVQTSVSPSRAPKVARPLDATRFINAPCSALTMANLTGLGVLDPINGARNGPGGVECTWTGSPGGSIGIWTTPGWLEAESSVKDDRYGSSEQVPG